MADDSTINLEMISVMVGDVYNLKFATDGQKALDIVRRDKDIDLVLLDMIMPYMSGTEFLIEAKKDPELKNIPVIALTTSEDNEAACLNLGAVDFIKKPFPIRTAVLAKIENALNSTQKSTGFELDSYINALFSEYQTVYLIDAVNDSYESISEDENIISLNLPTKGENFFEDFRENAKKVVYPEDCEYMMNAFDKDTLITTLRSNQGFAMDYRLSIGGEPKHYRLKAMLVPDENPQIIIGIISTEEEIIGMETLYAFRNDARNYASIAQALAQDYMCIYYVHLASNRFIEYTCVPEYEPLQLEKSGDNFFTFGLKSFLRGVNPVDTERVTHQFTKENVLKTIEEHKAFTIQFRLTFEESDEYVSLKATKLINDGIEYLVVGISNIDAQMNAQ